jgi:hypothetical protein
MVRPVAPQPPLRESVDRSFAPVCFVFCSTKAFSRRWIVCFDSKAVMQRRQFAGDVASGA